MDVTKQEDVDKIMLELDGTPNKCKYCSHMIFVLLCLCVITQKMEICYLWECGDEKTQIVV